MTSVRYLAILLSFLWPKPSNGQKIRFTDTTNIWQTYYQYWGGANWLKNTTFQGDTLWNGIHYYKMSGFLATQDWEFIVREDTASNKIYFRVIKTDVGVVDTNEHLGYDFGLKVGDTITKRGIDNKTGILQVDKIDSVLIQNVYHKVWYFQVIGGASIAGFSYWAIEGIGDMRGPTYGFVSSTPAGSLFLNCFSNKSGTPAISPPVGSFDNIGSCTVGSKEIFAVQTFTLYPNPSNDGVFYVRSDNTHEKGEIELFNSYGVKVRETSFSNIVDISDLARGIYFYRMTFSDRAKVFTGHLFY